MARKGEYPNKSVENIESSTLNKYFRQTKNSYEVVKMIRDKVVFAKHNLIEDPPFSRIDLITCRNLLIYFNTNLQKKVFQIFHYSLQKNGMLFLGKSESPGNSEDLYHVVNAKHKIYSRKFLGGKESTYFGNMIYPVLSSGISASKKKPSALVSNISESIILAIAPHSVLINENMDIKHFYGEIKAFIDISPGQATMNIVNIMRKEFQQEIRALVYKSIRKNTSSFGQSRKMVLGGVNKQVQITIHPLVNNEWPDKMLLVSFNVKAVIETPAEDGTPLQDDPRVSELEQELTSTKEHLQTVIEELETSNEELQSLNEELQSSNEELQSSNEELETSNEELQSTNEELTTVNEELQVRSMELIDANNNLNNIKDSVDFPIVVVDKNLRITLANTSSQEVFLFEESVVGQILTSVPTEVSLPYLRQNILDVIKSQETYTEQIDSIKSSYWLRVTPFVTSEKQVAGAVVVFINNTETRRAEALLKESEERFRAILNHTTSIIYMKDLKGRILLANTRFLNLYQVKAEGVIGHTDFDFFPQHQASMIKVHDNEVIKNQKSSMFEEVIQNKEGQDRTYISVKYPLYDAKGEIYAVCAILTDITERKKAEFQLTSLNKELMRSNKELDDFAYITSHDLKEPLRGIRNYSTFLLEDYEDKLEEEGRQKLHSLITLSGRMQKLLDNLLHYSRVGRLEINTSPVDLDDSVRRILELMFPLIEETGVDVRIPRALPAVICNPVRISEVFRNIIDNAIRYSNKKKRWVEIGYEGDPDGSRPLIFFVRDNGIGIKEDKHDDIFAIFKRLHTRDKYGGGIGVGLTITKKIIEYHKGEIWVESKVGEGTTVFFTLGDKQ